MKQCLFSLLFLFLFACGEIENVDVFIDAPAVVKIDEDFEITVKMVNTAKSSQTLNSIDISDRYLKGIIITKIDPEYKESTHVPIDNSISYTYNQSLPPGDTLVFTIYCNAIASGDFKGDFDFCINSDFNFMTKNVRTVVK